MKIAAILIISLFFISCVSKSAPEKKELPAYFKVEFAPGSNTGTPENRLPNQINYSFTISAEAYGSDNLPYNYNGQASVSLIQAALTSQALMQFTNGRADNFKVTFKYAAEKERIVITALDPDKTDLGTKIINLQSGPVGVSDTIYLPYATIPLIKQNNSGNGKDGFASLFNKKNLTLKGGNMLVLAVIEGGFYLIDTDAKEYAGIYLYTYSSPFVDDIEYGRSALEPGTVIEEVNGSVYEFYGFTEMNFPTFTPGKNADGSILVDKSLIPQPVDITSLIDANNDADLEKYESTLVTVKGVTVDDFDESDDGYVSYGQFPLLTANNGVILLQTISTVTGFKPSAEKGTKFTSVTGILKQHTSARPTTRILVPRNQADMIRELKKADIRSR